MNPPSLIEHIQTAKKGSERGQEWLYKHLYGYGVGIAKNYLTLTHLEDFDVTGNFRTWFRKILMRTLIDIYRKEVRHKADDIDVVYDLSYDNGVESELHAEDIMAMLEQVSISYRMVFLMHVVDGYTLKDIASRLDITEGGVKTLYYKARQKMREILNKNGYNYESTSNKK